MRRRMSVYAQEYTMSRQIMRACQHASGLYVPLTFSLCIIHEYRLPR